MHRFVVLCFSLMYGFLLSGGLLFQTLNGQTVTEIWNTGNSPLPGNEINCIALDQSGIVWIGTESGLASFNGNNWEVFTTENSPLTDHRIRSLGVDDQNRIWVGTFNGGLALYDSGDWTTYTTANSGLPDNYVKSIAFDPDQRLWLGLSGGLASFDGTQWQLFTATGAEVLLNNVNDVIFDLSKNIWVCTVNGGLVSMGKNGMLIAFNLANSGVPDNTLLAVTSGTDNVKWMTTPTDGIGRYDGTLWQTFNTSNSGLASNLVTDIVAVPQNEAIYIGTTNAGLSIYHPPANTWNNLTTGLPDLHITAIAASEAASAGVNLWLGTNTGGLVLVNDNITSVNFSASHTFTPYPNPARHLVCLNLPPTASVVKAQVFPVASGNCVLETAPVNTNCFSVENLPDGLYFLRLWFDDGQSSVVRFAVLR